MDVVRRASDELYAMDPEQFVSRRAELATAARSAGDPVAAKRIAGLHKPTRSAWTVNSLARAEPELLGELIELGDQLRQAEHSLDGDQLRELSRRRGQLVESLVRAAFRATGQRSGSGAVGEEVRSTLSAAVADAEVAELVTSGTLIRSARWDGFGGASRPDLALVPPPATRKPAKDATRSRPTKTASAEQARPANKVADAQRGRAEREHEQKQRAQQRVAAAADLVDEIRRELSAAEQDEIERLDSLHRIEAELADARRELDQARAAARRARSRLRSAEQQLHRVEH